MITRRRAGLQSGLAPLVVANPRTLSAISLRDLQGQWGMREALVIGSLAPQRRHWLSGIDIAALPGRGPYRTH